MPRLICHYLALLTLACAGQVNAQTLTLLHFNDLHAHLTPHTDLVEVDGQATLVKKGGLARLATLVKNIRREVPSAVLMNVGDTYHGGAEALFTNGNAIVDPVNALGIDVGVPGNWDFAYGPAVTRLRYTKLGRTERRALAIQAGEVKQPNFINLAANVTYSQPLWKKGEPLLQPTLLKEVNGVKVGFIGLTSDIVAEMHEMLARGLHFVTGEPAYRALLEKHAGQLRQQGARVVVVMSELGLHKDVRLADVLTPGTVDVFFSAHTHELTREPIHGRSGALVVEAGNDGWLGRMDIEVSSGRAPAFRWKVLPIDESLHEDPRMKALVETARAPFLRDDPGLAVPMQGIDHTLHQALDSVVGHSNVLLHRRNSLESPFNAAWTESLRQYAGTQAALSPGFRFDAVVAATGMAYEDPHVVANGAMTLEDVYRYFPVPYTMAVGEIDGVILRGILEANLAGVYSQQAFSQHGGWTDGWAGIQARIDLAAQDGQRVQTLAYADGTPLADDATISVAGCQRPMDAADVLCSHDGFANVRPLLNPATGTPWYVQDLFVELMASNALALPPSPGLQDASGTPMWPEAPYVQPLW